MVKLVDIQSASVCGCARARLGQPYQSSPWVAVSMITALISEVTDVDAIMVGSEYLY